MAVSIALIASIVAASLAGGPPKTEVQAVSAALRGPVHRAGRIGAADYPAPALRARAEGIAGVRLAVGADGRVTGCAVERSTGNWALDSATCTLARRRFRYSPAADGAGRPTAGSSRYEMVWRLPDENPDSSGKTPAPD